MNIKKTLLLVSLLLIVPFFFIYAAPPVLPTLPVLPTGQSPTNIWTSVANIAKWLFSFLILAGVIGVIIGGYMFVSSGGDSGKVTSARNWLIYSLVGVLVGSFAVGFINWVTGLKLTI